MTQLYFPRLHQLAMVATCAVLLATIGTVNATVVFSEDFNDITVNMDPPGLPLAVDTAGNSFTTAVTPLAGNTITVRIDSANLFGLGGTNQYLEMIDASTAGNPVVRGPTGTISGTGFQLTLDFYDPTDGTDRGTRIALGNSSTASNSRPIDIELQNGTLGTANNAGAFVATGTYSQDVKHRLAVVGNYSGATINYGAGGSQSVAPGKQDIWVDNILLADDLDFRNAVTSSTHLAIFGAAGSTKSATYFDNIVVQDQITLFSLTPGDCDGDGDVDGADFMAWQTNFPKSSEATLAQGDADGDGDVDGADFVVWQTHFPYPASPGISPVPEPGAMILLGIGAIVVPLIRGRAART